MKQALYRKYRPSDFDKLYGQDNIVNILKNQIKNNNISHAYIFSGTRGTGKTSTAKIFAKAVNCLNPQDGNPCNKCENCKSIIEEKTMDIVEMDAASNRRIDDIRQLRDQVIYPPTTLKYKVYIIDEAHMITNEGFNALLKVMEEPPRHLIFILATTEIEKIPETILSRTQRFEFKSISTNDIKSQIDVILDRENIKIEDRAKDIIANVASGAMRDALSVLDQVISIGKDEITTSEVYDLLGLFSDEIKKAYCKYIFEKDIKGLLSLIDTEIDKGKNPNNFIKEVIQFFKDLIYAKIGIKNLEFSDLINDISLEQLINSVDILLEYEELMKKSDSSDLLFRVASVRLIDFMSRRQMESMIKNLELRVEALEKNEIVVEKKRAPIKVTGTDKIELAEDGSFFSEKIIPKDENEAIEKASDLDNVDTTNVSKEEIIKQTEKQSQSLTNQEISDILLNALSKYPQTEMMLNGLQEVEIHQNRAVLYLDKEAKAMTLGLRAIFNKVEQELKETIKRSFTIETRETKDRNQNKLNQDTIENLKNLFGDDLNIKDKR
ncbi:DNA polymerase III subunit gamma/tau [Helcococcus sueciensis]|uniref:DNA polymerase III subunit gamma/tau n=1 Tax=Helcococcus sueciensis TaxID=241555 RepID=UPI0003F8C714|nr:DNA polymerase III subunit gamma/tau [Helcococcus sueciensis]